MNDLVERARKCAVSAGRTGRAQYRAAEQDERLARWLGWTSTALSALVGTSIFADWVRLHPVPFGIAAAAAAALSALARSAKLDERANAHRDAGAEYGRLRRRADSLRLQIEGADIGDRSKAILELDQIGESLSELAKTTRSLPDGVYLPASRAFDADHREYFPSPITHAGGVVVRGEGPARQYLVVQARKKSENWVLPKGHVKADESLEVAARREVLEETGVAAAVWADLDTVGFDTKDGRVEAQFYLMTALKEGPSTEHREKRWLSFEEAMVLLKFKESKRLVAQAYVEARRAET
jgi:ADP-ribose pyrophosphatase YjhB (NUDIX family)